MNTRKIFIDTLSELTRKDPSIMLVVCDVGFSYIEDYAKEFPDNFLNTGVTEQSTVGICAGMALTGLKPYYYSMIPFVLFRPAEQVRDDIINHDANVKLIGVQGSEHYKFLGKSHNLLHDKEDTNFCDNIGLEWKIPNPRYDPDYEVKEIITKAYESDRPLYVRL